MQGQEQGLTIGGQEMLSSVLSRLDALEARRAVVQPVEAQGPIQGSAEAASGEAMALAAEQSVATAASGEALGVEQVVATVLPLLQPIQESVAALQEFRAQQEQSALRKQVQQAEIAESVKVLQQQGGAAFYSSR